MGANHATSLGRPGTRRAGWPVDALLVVGGWLLVLSSTRVTAGVVSAVTAGGAQRPEVVTGERR